MHAREPGGMVRDGRGVRGGCGMLTALDMVFPVEESGVGLLLSLRRHLIYKPGATRRGHGQPSEGGTRHL